MYIMDATFGKPETQDGEIHVSIRNGDGRPMFKQFNKVKIDEITDDSITINVQDNDLGCYDNDILAAAKINKTEWFGRELADSTLDKRYSPAVNDNLFSVNILKDKLRCYDHERNLVDNENIQPGMVCSVVAELRRIWFDKRNYGPDWFIVQVRLEKPPEKDHYGDYLFQDD